MRKITGASLTLLALALARAPVALAQSQPQLPSNVTIYPMGNFAENAMVSSLAGVVNRKTNGELMLTPNNGSLPNPRFWLDQLKAQYPAVTSGVQSNTLTLLNQFKSHVSGYVLYDRTSNPDSLNIATSIAGVTDSIIVDSSTRLTAILAGLPMTADARSMTYASAYATYGSQFNKDIIVHQDLGFDHHLRDFAIQNRAFVYWTNPTSLNPSGQPAYASNQNRQGRIFGWANSEQDLFAQASQSNQQVVASNYSWSTSTTAKWKVPVQAQKSHPAGSIATQAGKHYVAFVMSDGDNAQWLTNGFATDPKWFGSPHRGNFNMTWDFTPSLMDMNPVAHNYLYGHASSGVHTDTFVAAGGAGTAFPSQTPDIEGLAQSINDSMARADLRVTSILDTAYDTGKLFPIVDRPQVMGMMFKNYGNYYRRSGSIPSVTWRNGKPIMSVKYSLWDGADSAQLIAAALNATTRLDPIDDAASYDIINVHPWSTTGPDGTGTGDPMSNLNALVQLLDPNKVQVVGLEELFVHLRNHFGTPLPGAQVNATWIRDASSNWGSTRTNWSGALPNFIDAKVNFLGGMTGNRVVTVGGNVTAGTINFDNPTFRYTIGPSAAGSSLMLDVTSGEAKINVVSGTHTISAPLTLADDTRVTVTPANASLTLSDIRTSPAKLTKAGAGTLTLSGGASGQPHGGGTVVEAGTLVITDTRALGSGPLTVNDGAIAQIKTGIPNAVSVASVNTSGGGVLDLTNDSMVVKNSTPAAVGALLASGFAHGAWNGPGINSSTAAGDAAHITAVGYAGNDVLNKSTFGGTTGLDADDVLVKYTYYGDADLSGVVTLDDFTLFLGGYQSGGSGWVHGDFDYSGVVTLDDFTLFLSGYQAQGASLTAVGQVLASANQLTEAERAAMLAAIQAVPEPIGGTALAISALVILRPLRPRRAQRPNGSALA